MTLAQNWYDLKLRLCSAYPGLDPVRILDYPLVDVLELIKEHLDHTQRAQLQQPIQTPQRPQSYNTGAGVIRLPADDSWF